jgi:KDO2-lipid IV(A) lauroyltransferase
MAKLILSNALSKRIDGLPALRNLRWRLEAATLGLFWWICARLSPDKASAFGRRLLAAIGPKLRKSGHMQRNLAVAFPELDEGERRALLRRVWGNTGAVFAEYPHFPTLCRRDFDAHFEVVSRHDLTDYRAGRKRGIFVTAHLGNWELAVAPALHLGLSVAAVYAPIKNPVIDRMLKRKRAALGCELVNRDTGLPHLIAALREGRSLGLVVDHRDDSGIPLPFFGLDKLTTVVPARLALRFGCELIPTRIERLEGTRFRVSVCEPIRPDPALGNDRAQAAQMMAKLNAMFEQWIRERPEQWLCTKRAWAKTLYAPPDRSKQQPSGRPTDHGQVARPGSRSHA